MVSESNHVGDLCVVQGLGQFVLGLDNVNVIRVPNVITGEDGQVRLLPE